MLFIPIPNGVLEKVPTSGWRPELAHRFSAVTGGRQDVAWGVDEGRTSFQAIFGAMGNVWGFHERIGWPSRLAIRMGALARLPPPMQCTTMAGA